MKAALYALMMILTVPFLRSQDAAALEEQYKTCARHFIPSEKCTPEIYRQLKEKDAVPLDPKVAFALKGIKTYQQRLKNPESLQIHSAYVTDNGDACLEVGGQNSLGGQTVSRIVYLANGKFRGDSFFGALRNQERSDGGDDYWMGVCLKGFRKKLVPGTDVTEKVKQAFSEAR